MTHHLPRTLATSLATLLATSLATSLLLVACASTPVTHFYTLESLVTPNLVAGDRPVRIGQVTVPELVDRPQMVLRSGTNQVSLAEQRRWAESLRSAIARVITVNLTIPGRATVPATTTVDIDIVRFDSQLGVAVELAANWRIRPATGTISSRSMTWREPVAGNDYADLAAAHSRALAELSRQIAATVDGRP